MVDRDLPEKDLRLISIKYDKKTVYLSEDHTIQEVPPKLLAWDMYVYQPTFVISL